MFFKMCKRWKGMPLPYSQAPAKEDPELPNVSLPSIHPSIHHTAY